MATPYKPPPMEIPAEYADSIGHDRSHIYHVNAGRKRLTVEKACRLLEIGAKDPRLEGLNIFDLAPEAEMVLEHICKLCPLKLSHKQQKKLEKKKERKNKPDR